MRSTKSSLMAFLAVGGLALAASSPNVIRRTENPTPTPRKRPVKSPYPDEHRAWNEAVDAKRAAKKARKL